jgi:hypothetical protein
MKKSATLLASTLGLAVLLGLGYWLAGGVAQLSRSIFPGMPNSASGSMQPYELAFKFDVSEAQGGNASLVEWHLKLPRAFVWNELGGNNSVGGGDHHHFHSADIAAVINLNSGEFSPSVFSNAKDNSVNGYFVYLENGPVGRRLSKTEKCVRNDEIDEFFGHDKLPSRVCSKDASVERRCLVYMHYEGWGVQVNMPKSSYFSDYQKACDVVTTFLKKYTSSVDDVREVVN